jgi:hypothetical protein
MRTWDGLEDMLTGKIICEFNLVAEDNIKARLLAKDILYSLEEEGNLNIPTPIEYRQDNYGFVGCTGRLPMKD